MTHEDPYRRPIQNLRSGLDRNQTGADSRNKTGAETKLDPISDAFIVARLSQLVNNEVNLWRPPPVVLLVQVLAHCLIARGQIK